VGVGEGAFAGAAGPVPIVGCFHRGRPLRAAFDTSGQGVDRGQGACLGEGALAGAAGSAPIAGRIHRGVHDARLRVLPGSERTGIVGAVRPWSWARWGCAIQPVFAAYQSTLHVARVPPGAWCRAICAVGLGQVRSRLGRGGSTAFSRGRGRSTSTGSRPGVLTAAPPEKDTATRVDRSGVSRTAVGRGAATSSCSACPAWVAGCDRPGAGRA